MIIMCEKPPCCGPPKDVPPKWFKFRNCLRALRFRTRWMIIEYIGNGKKSTEEIYNYLLKKGEELTKSGLYYHLSELKSAGIIEVAEYIERGGAPEKIWRLKTKKIVINLLEKQERKKPRVSK